MSKNVALKVADLTVEEFRTILKNPDAELNRTTDYIPAKDVANKLGVTPNYIYLLVKEGKIPYVRLGKKLVFSKKDVEAFMEKKRSKYILN